MKQAENERLEDLQDVKAALRFAIASNAKLERENRWLADQLAHECCAAERIDDAPHCDTPPDYYACASCWLDQAHKAIRKEDERNGK